MTNIKTPSDLVNRLRETASKGVSVWGDLQMEAAREIEILTAEREAYVSAMDRLQSAQPVAQPLTDKRISWLWSESHNDTTDRMAFQVFARAIEASHGINGMVEAATRPAIDAASKQGGQHE